MPPQFIVKVANTAEEVRAAQEIRTQVFVEEQGIPRELDSDGLDQLADHVLVLDGNRPAATGRLMVPSLGKEVLARIAVLPEYRGCGLGKIVVRRLEALAVEQEVRELTLEPHRYLQGFYEDLGYRKVSGTSVAGGYELITMWKVVSEP